MKISAVFAYRTSGIISVIVAADLPTACDSAKIIDKYPGGNRIYVKDPGEAQVFIEYQTSPELCPQVLVPWIGKVEINDEFHEKVGIYINNVPAFTSNIISIPKEAIPFQDKLLFSSTSQRI